MQKEGTSKGISPCIKEDLSLAPSSGAVRNLPNVSWHTCRSPLVDKSGLSSNTQWMMASAAQKGGQGSVVGPKVDNSWWTISTLQPAWRTKIFHSVLLSRIYLPMWLTLKHRAWHGDHQDRTAGWVWAERVGGWLGILLHPHGPESKTLSLSGHQSWQ